MSWQPAPVICEVNCGISCGISCGTSCWFLNVFLSPSSVVASFSTNQLRHHVMFNKVFESCCRVIVVCYWATPRPSLAGIGVPWVLTVTHRCALMPRMASRQSANPFVAGVVLKSCGHGRGRREVLSRTFCQKLEMRKLTFLDARNGTRPLSVVKKDFWDSAERKRDQELPI